MMKISLFFSVVIFAFSCGSHGTEKTTSTEKTETKDPLEVRNLLKEYEVYVTSLDSTTEKSVSLATDKYIELFSKSDPKLCDSAFVVFDKLYGKIENGLNERLMNDKFFTEFSCITFDSLGREEPFEKKYLSFKKRIEKHGFRIDCPEGTAEIGQDRSFISKHIYKYVSPVMKRFLEGLRKENDDWFSDDAGISISAEEYVDRLIWWEKFNQANPDFILSGKAKSYQILLFHFLLTGMDNTPLMDNEFDENGMETEQTINTYFLDAYAYLNKKYPASQTNTLVKPYAAAIRKNDQLKIEKLIKTYTKRGLMIDFEKGYNLDL